MKRLRSISRTTSEKCSETPMRSRSWNWLNYRTEIQGHLKKRRGNVKYLFKACDKYTKKSSQLIQWYSSLWRAYPCKFIPKSKWKPKKNKFKKNHFGIKNCFGVKQSCRKKKFGEKIFFCRKKIWRKIIFWRTKFLP